MREFVCQDVSRSGLDRCLRRHGVGSLKALLPTTPKEPHKAFKAYEPGYLHMDVKYLPQMADEQKRSYLFVAIDRAIRWVFVQIKGDKSARSASSFLMALHKACPIKIQKLLTDNGKEFTDRLFASREREPSGEHQFDQLCQALGIEHRFTKPRTPKTNGMVERFNGRIADVLKTHRFNTAEDMGQTLMRYVALYNHQLPRPALKSKTPMQAMKDCYASHPHLFRKRQYDRPGCDSYSVAVAGEGVVKAPESPSVDLVSVLQRRSVTVLTLGSDEPVADSGKNGHSVFAWSLMTGLKNLQKWEASSRVFNTVRQEVESELPQSPRYSVVLSAGHEPGGEFLFEQRSRLK